MANEKTVSTKSSEEHVSTAFKWFHATSVNGGAMIIAAVISSFFSVYMTDTIGLPAASASLIMFIATFWDACNDPMMGVIADRTKSRWGRYRPYFIAAPILLTLFSVLIWVNPDFSMTGKFVWVLVTYIGYGMTVTMYTMPQVAVLPACVKSNERRNMIITMGAGVCSVAFLIGNTFTPNLTGFFEGLGFSNGYIPLRKISSAGTERRVFQESEKSTETQRAVPEYYCMDHGFHGIRADVLNICILYDILLGETGPDSCLYGSYINWSYGFHGRPDADRAEGI